MPTPIELKCIDPGATVDYHLNQLAGITPAYANAPIVIEPTVDAVRKAING